MPKLYRETYKIGDTTTLTTTATAVKALADRFTRWALLNRGYHALVDKLKTRPAGTSPAPAATRIRDDSDFLLDMTAVEPTDDAEAAALAQRMTEQTAIVYVYAAAKAKLPAPPWPEQHPIADPDKIYGDSPPVETRTAVDAHQLRYRLLRALRLLAHPEGVKAITDACAADPDKRLEDIVVRRLDWDPPGPIRRLGRALVLHFDSPEHLRRVVRRWDWAVFWLVAVLTALVYLLPAYVGKDYGSLEDYLTAFAAGAVVPTTINWALLPFARPQTAETKAPAKKREEEEADY